MQRLTRFHDRHDAGRQLARRLGEYAGRDDVLVLALPRGGVPVAAEVADALDAPLDVFLVRKLGLPGREEFAMGAIAMGGVQVLNQDVVRHFGVSAAQVAAVVAEEQAELERRARLYRGDRPPPALAGRTVLIVDDGLATGATMRAAVQALRARGPARIVVAVPVAAPEACEEFRHEADDAVCALTPERFEAVGLWYEDFSQTSDAEVRRLLAEAAQRRAEGGHAPAHDTPADAGEHGPQAVRIAVAPEVELDADLVVPPDARALVLFAHGSGSSRHSRRNQQVARGLERAGFATLLLDLLTAEEDAAEQAGARRRFDVGWLAERLVAAAEWAREQPALRALPIAVFGASTGGGAALVMAAWRPDLVASVVSRGGRPDLAGSLLPQVQAPTLLLVGERDPDVLALNRHALERLAGPRALVVVPGATHLFEEPGALEQVAAYAEEWIGKHA